MRPGSPGLIFANLCSTVPVPSGQKKGLGEGANQFLTGDCLDLPFEDASFDLVTIAFGLRNLADRGQKVCQKCSAGAPPGWPVDRARV